MGTGGQPTATGVATTRRAVCRAAARVLLFGAMTGGGLVTGACDDRRPPTPAPTPATQPSTTRPTSAPATAPAIPLASLDARDPTPARPGMLVGRILDANGKMLQKSGIRVEVVVQGVSEKTTEKVTVVVEAAPDGSFAKPIERGSYRRPTARIEFPFRGRDGLTRTYRLPLVPMRTIPSLQEADEGVAQDFKWQLSGLRDGATADPTRSEPWIGGTMNVRYVGYRPDVERNVPTPPPGAKVVLTLTPQGNLADGTEGKPITIERPYNAGMTGLTNTRVTDLPLANYTITGHEVFPEGKTAPLLFWGGGKWSESTERSFSPDLENAALESVMLDFTRPLES